MTARTNKSRKQKARRIQNEVADDIRTAFHLGPLDVEGRGMGHGGIDIILSERARAIFPYGIECKWQEELRVWRWLEQTDRNARAEQLIPLLVMKYNTSPCKSVIIAIVPDHEAPVAPVPIRCHEEMTMKLNVVKSLAAVAAAAGQRVPVFTFYRDPRRKWRAYYWPDFLRIASADWRDCNAAMGVTG